MNLSQTLRALAHRNFRLFFMGQGVSLIGTWMQQVALQWVVYQLKKVDGQQEQPQAAFWLGLVTFASQIPAFFLAPVAGVFVDRWNRHRLIILTQTLAMLQAFLLAALTLSHTIDIYWIMALSVLMGLINAFDMPGRQAFMTEMLDNKEDLSNAIALNSSMFNGARLVGPALAAMLLVAVGSGVCFLLNAVSYFAVLAALLSMRITPRTIATVRPPLYRGLSEGFAYVFGFAPLRNILLLVALMSLAGISYTVLLPIIATQVLHGKELLFGILTIAGGCGALCGAVILAARTSVRGLGRWILVAPSVVGLGLIALSFSGLPWLSTALVAAIGFGMMVQMGASNIVMQTIVDEDKRGRLMSFYTMAFMGMSPLGSLLFGSVLTPAFGPAVALQVAGAACVAGSIAFAFQFRRLRELIRPIYIRMGIIPEVPVIVPTVAPPEAPVPVEAPLPAVTKEVVH